MVLNKTKNIRSLYYKDGIFQEGFYEGKYAFWRVIGKNTFSRIDLKTAIKVDEKIRNVFSKTDLEEAFDIVEIEDYRVALYYKNGIFEKVLTSGTYAASKQYYNNTFVKIDLREPVVYDETMEKVFDSDIEFIHDFDIKKVREKELLLWYQDGLFKSKCLVGNYLFWNKLKDNYFEIIDLNNLIEIDEKYYGILNRLEGIYTKFEVKDYEAGLLIIDNQYKRTLKPGVYYYWNGSQKIEIVPIDLRIKKLDMTGDDILTKDKYILKFSFMVQYRIVDSITSYKEIDNLENQIYILLQMALREYAGTQRVAQLFENRHKIGKKLLDKVKKEERKYGIEFSDSGVKDIILSGNLRDKLGELPEEFFTGVDEEPEEEEKPEEKILVAGISEVRPVKFLQSVEPSDEEVDETEHLERIKEVSEIPIKEDEDDEVKDNIILSENEEINENENKDEIEEEKDYEEITSQVWDEAIPKEIEDWDEGSYADVGDDDENEIFNEIMKIQDIQEKTEKEQEIPGNSVITEEIDKEEIQEETSELEEKAEEYGVLENSQELSGSGKEEDLAKPEEDEEEEKSDENQAKFFGNKSVTEKSSENTLSEEELEEERRKEEEDYSYEKKIYIQKIAEKIVEKMEDGDQDILKELNKILLK